MEWFVRALSPPPPCFSAATYALCFEIAEQTLRMGKNGEPNERRKEIDMQTGEERRGEERERVAGAARAATGECFESGEKEKR